jgi:UDP-glucose 4-epimerase
MRIVVTGASGNVGTALMSELLTTSGIDSVVGVARRPVPPEYLPEVEWHQAAVATDDLLPVFQGADALVHLAWLFQPTHRPDITWRVNVEGTARVLRAAVEAEIATVVVASSVGAYSARRSLQPVPESWPTGGVPTAAYSREKAYVERMLDSFEHEHPGVRVVRMRTAFVFQRTLAVQQRRLFLGPLVPGSLMLRHARIPVLPNPGGDLLIPALHAADAATAYRQAVLLPVRGAFNLASEPVLDLGQVAAPRRRPGCPGPVWGRTRRDGCGVGHAPVSGCSGVAGPGSRDACDGDGSGSRRTAMGATAVERCGRPGIPGGVACRRGRSHTAPRAPGQRPTTTL